MSLRSRDGVVKSFPGFMLTRGLYGRVVAGGGRGRQALFSVSLHTVIFRPALFLKLHAFLDDIEESKWGRQKKEDIPLVMAPALRSFLTGGFSGPSLCHGVLACFSFALPISSSK